MLLGSAAFLRAEDSAPSTQPAESALGFTMNDIDGHPVELSKYTGQVVLMVNVASKCGNTPQYEGLEAMYQKYKDQGLVILGFPANNFGHQEPGSNEQIKDFCQSTYNVKFPMFSKISVKGEDIAPLYQFLTHQQTTPQPAGEITWNFEKFLIGRDGKVIARFSPRTQPSDPKIVEAIEAQLGTP
ncbi:MAG: glutathione peroxidase [Phycisphaerales bacterium]|nr:glutathione peroxidase [Phycisphaerales bacterium]